MPTSLISANTPIEEISDEKLLEEFQTEKNYKKATLYALIARRANQNEKVKDLLLRIIQDTKLRSELFMNTITHSWVPILFVMEESSESVKEEVRKSIEDSWSDSEKRNFLDYIKLQPEYFDFFKTLKPGFEE